MTIKVLIIVSNLKEGGGAENSSRTLAKGLVTLGYDVEMLTFYDFENEYDIGNLKRRNFSDAYSQNILTKFYRFIIKYPRKLYQLISKEEYDIIITNSEDANTVGSFCKRYFKFDAKLIAVIRTFIRDHPVYKYMANNHRYADLNITVSKYLCEVYKEKVNDDNVITIYNPFEFKLINQQKTQGFSSKEESLFNKTNLITVGRLSKVKNYFFLIDSLEGILKENKELQWLILGDGPLKEEIQNYIISKGLKDQIKLLGVKSNPFKYLYMSDLFVFGSQYEGFGRVLVESLACGTPVISVNCPSGPSEIIADTVYDKHLVKGYAIHQNGVLVEALNKEAFASAVEYALEKPIKVNANQSINQFGIDYIKGKRDKVLGELTE